MAIIKNSKVLSAAFIIVLLIFFVIFFLENIPMEFKFSGIPRPPFAPNQTEFSSNLDQIFTLSASAWTLKVADFSLSQTSSAAVLVNSLQKKGFRAYMRQVPLFGKPIIRVFVGPDIQLSRIKNLAVLLNKKMKFKTEIITFDPLL